MSASFYTQTSITGSWSLLRAKINSLQKTLGIFDSLLRKDGWQTATRTMSEWIWNRTLHVIICKHCLKQRATLKRNSTNLNYAKTIWNSLLSLLNIESPISWHNPGQTCWDDLFVQEIDERNKEQRRLGDDLSTQVPFRFSCAPWGERGSEFPNPMCSTETAPGVSFKRKHGLWNLLQHCTSPDGCERAEGWNEQDTRKMHAHATTKIKILEALIIQLVRRFWMFLNVFVDSSVQVGITRATHRIYAKTCQP